MKVLKHIPKRACKAKIHSTHKIEGLVQILPYDKIRESYELVRVSTQPGGAVFFLCGNDEGHWITRNGSIYYEATFGYGPISLELCYDISDAVLLDVDVMMFHKLIKEWIEKNAEEKV